MEEFETLSEQLARVTAECERLREENARLCNLLPAHARPAIGAQVEPLALPNPVAASPPARIYRFRRKSRCFGRYFAVGRTCTRCGGRRPTACLAILPQVSATGRL